MSDTILPSEISKKLSQARQGKKVVLVTGVFDLLHQEHQAFLNKAKALGDILVVAVESDVRVREIKGEGRPVFPQNHRVQMILDMGITDVVFVLPEDFSHQEKYRQLIAEVSPEYYAVSSHTSYLENKKTLVEAFGGQLIIAHQHNPEISTTQLLAQSRQK
jgi:D-beta-D-heptose 7-phosphate kinase / D-beta-D-heptose 1-phosphate adenosyltransferase